MLLILCFLMGIGNFAMHKAVAESGHPFVRDTKLYFGKHFGQYGSYSVEWLMLAGAMYFAHEGSFVISSIYAAYTAVNALAAWLLLSGRI